MYYNFIASNLLTRHIFCSPFTKFVIFLFYYFILLKVFSSFLAYDDISFAECMPGKKKFLQAENAQPKSLPHISEIGKTNIQVFSNDLLIKQYKTSQTNLENIEAFVEEKRIEHNEYTARKTKSHDPNFKKVKKALHEATKAKQLVEKNLAEMKDEYRIRFPEKPVPGSVEESLQKTNDVLPLMSLEELRKKNELLLEQIETIQKEKEEWLTRRESFERKLQEERTTISSLSRTLEKWSSVIAPLLTKNPELQQNIPQQIIQQIYNHHDHSVVNHGFIFNDSKVTQSNLVRGAQEESSIIFEASEGNKIHSQELADSKHEKQTDTVFPSEAKSVSVENSSSDQTKTTEKEGHSSFFTRLRKKN